MNKIRHVQKVQKLQKVEKHAAQAPCELMFSLIQAADLIRDRLEQAFAGVGLSSPKFGALTKLAEADEPLSLGELAECLTCVRSNITQLVDRLEADGLVRRENDSEDRRCVRAAVTPLGRQRQAQGAQKLEEVQREFANRLEGVDSGMLHRALSALR